MLDSTKNDFNTKCAEVHCYNADNYEILCTYCELITKSFHQFREHFQKLHLEEEHLKHRGDKLSEIEDEEKNRSIHSIKEESRSDLEEVEYGNGSPADEERNNETLEKIKLLLNDAHMENEDEGFTQIEVEFNDRGHGHESLQEDTNELLTGSKEETGQILIINPTQTLDKSNEQKSSRKSRKRTEKGTTTSAKEFKCNICNKSFSFNSNRKMHELRHSEKRDFGCSLCPKSFYSQCELRNHMRWHTDERSFVCEECGKAFRHSWVLKKHHRTHTTTNPTLPCPECGKLFAYKDNLRNHLETHRTDRSFDCSLCNRSYTQRKHLAAHTRRHHATKS